MKINLIKLPAIYGLIGAMAGYLFLHPASMFIHQYYYDHMMGWGFLPLSFSPEHLVMALYYAMIGALAGILFGIHPQRMSRLLARVKRLASTDDLTGIYNRRYFFQRFKQELERSTRYGRRTALLMLDIDHFKHYNDVHGHQMGDSLLKKLAQLLSISIRQPDFIARYGGEEFVVVAPETGREEVVQLAEKLRSAVEKHPFLMRESQPDGKITISIGVAVFPEDGRSVDEMVGKADAALYIAKDLGRNRVVSG
ncbi:MAG: GGDEF domain-containing protein [Candidatus Edwardsbacteria bacterium]|nr:GGDEF domain-containing protein [Candidatus Edwardsbacteria bacterium]